MATVKFSRDLREAIINRAAAQFQGAVTTANNSSPKDWGDKLYKIIFADVLPIMKQLPPEFFPKKNTISIRQVGGQHVGLQYTMKKTRCFPHDYPGDFRATKSHYSDDLSLVDIPEFAEFKAEVAAWKGRVHSATQRQTEYKDSVKQVVEAYATLAPALKAWPPLWDLVPDTTKEVHKKIVERERQEVNLNVDLNKMTAMAAYTKIRDNNK